jgi:hypothetical protein
LIEKTEDLDTLLFVLADLYDEAKRILKQRNASANEINRLITFIVDIRKLLTELQFTEKYRNDPRRTRSMQYLSDSGLDVEEMAREIMNELNGEVSV